jgi:tetratricopeptide (TPR) repeat protein
MNSIHDSHDPLDRIEQTTVTFGHGQSASLAHGIQNIYYEDNTPSPTVPQVTIAPPLGRLSKKLPLRGRTALINQIQDGPGQGRITGVHVIHGLAGSGKTSLALEIVSQAMESEIPTWWITANSASSVAIGLKSLAASIGVSEIELTNSDPADALWRRLNQLDEPWMLVIDNVDDPSILSPASDFADGTGWIRPPLGSNGGILITTRLATASIWGSWCSMHQTTMLDEDEGAKMLLDYVSSSVGSVDDARMLSARLGGLPLAIRLAGMYLAETSGIPWQEQGSLATIREYHEAVAAGLMPDIENRDALAQGWRLSLQLLDDRGYQFARQVLYLLSLFAESPFPFRLLLNPTALEKRPPFHGINGLTLWRTISALSDLGMVDLLRFDPAKTPDYLRIHPLVRDITRIGDPPGADGTDYFQTAAMLVHYAYRENDLKEARETTTWIAWGDLAPHVMALTRAAQGPEASDAAVEALDHVWCAFTDYLRARGMQVDAEDVTRLALAVSEQRLGGDPGAALHRRLHLAHILADRSKYQEAEATFKTTLSGFEDTFGPNSLKFLDVRHDYADFLRDQGEHARAEIILREVLAAQSDLLGEKHKATLVTRDCLARTLRDGNKLRDALAYYESALADRESVLGIDHDDTMFTRHHLAHTLAEMGRLDDAEEIHRSLLNDQISKHGPRSRTVHDGRHCLSHLLVRQGKLAEATEQAQLALDGRRSTLGDHHPDTLEMRTCVASLLHGEDPESAKDELVAVIEILVETLGSEHQQTLRSRHELAHMLSAAGDSTGAQRALSDLYIVQRRVLGPKHAHTRETKLCLDAEKRRASKRPGSFPLHGGGKSSGRKRGGKANR